MEKNIAVEIVNNEINVENDVTKKLTIILENHIGRIQKQKRIVTKLMQDNESAKHKCQVIKTLCNALAVNRFSQSSQIWVNTDRYNWNNFAVVFTVFFYFFPNKVQTIDSGGAKQWIDIKQYQYSVLHISIVCFFHSFHSSTFWLTVICFFSFSSFSRYLLDWFFFLFLI